MTDLDFIPPVIHAAAARNRSARTQVVWGACLAVVMMAWLSIHRLQVTRAENQLSAARTEQAQLATRQHFHDALVADRDRLSAAQQLQLALNDRASMVTIMAELAALLPDGAMLTDVSLEAPLNPATVPEPVKTAPVPNMPATPPPPLPVADHWPRLHIGGVAPDNVLVSGFTAKLGGSPLFRDVQTSMVRDEEYAGRTVRAFSVECFVVPQKGGPR